MFWKKKKRAAKAIAFDQTIESHNSALAQLRVKASELSDAVEKRRKIQDALEDQFIETIKKIEG